LLIGSRIEKATELKKAETKKTEPRIGQSQLESAQKHYYPKLLRSKPVFSKDNPLMMDDFNYLLFSPIVKTPW
jgi:hypothetical protein